MNQLTKEFIDQIRTTLKSFVPADEAVLLKNMLHEYAKVNYKPKNTPDEYLRFINRWCPSFEKVNPQSTNFPYYLKMFTTVSQHVYGDCAEECLDIAIEYEKGKPWLWFATKEASGQYKTTYKIHRDTEVVSAKVAFDQEYHTDYLGMDGQYFKIPFDRPFNKEEAIVVAGWMQGILRVIDNPVHCSKEINGETIYYWEHTVQRYENRTGYFHPVKYARKGIIYNKIMP